MMADVNGTAAAGKAVAKAEALAAGLPQDAPVKPPAVVTLDLEVREADSKAQKAKTVMTTGISKRTGKEYYMVTAAPGFGIARVILTDRDENGRCRCAVIAERRRGRPANSQREGKE